MLSIFSCDCWPFVCLLWENVYSGSLPIFNGIICVLAIELYELLISFGYYPCQTCGLQIFFPIPQVNSIFLLCGFFCFAEPFSLMQSYLFFFFFVVCALRIISVKINKQKTPIKYSRGQKGELSHSEMIEPNGKKKDSSIQPMKNHGLLVSCRPPTCVSPS